MAKSLIHLLFVTLYAIVGAGHDECGKTRCNEQGPVIRFPFRLKGHHPNHCGYPGFVLSCAPKSNATMLELPSSVQLLVAEIDYSEMLIHVTNLNGGCLLKDFPELRLSASPFQIAQPTYDSHLYCNGYTYAYCYLEMGYAFFNCSPPERDSSSMVHISCLDRHGYYVYADSWHSGIMDEPLVSCSKMYTVNSSIFEINMFGSERDYLQLSWYSNLCEKCTQRGRHCRLTNKGYECYVPRSGGSSHKVDLRKVVPASVSVLVILGLFFLIRSIKMKKEDQFKIEKFLADYRALKPSRYSYADIKKITNQFREKLGQGGYGTVYKGNLSNDVVVAVKVLKDSTENGVDDFINEVATIGRIHHVNVVRMVGYCADGSTRALIYEFLQNDSLQKFISWEKQNRNTDWEMLQRIALGIAKGIEYLHQGCDKRILHFDIKPNNILLDHNFTPKIADFGLAKLCSKEKSTISMTAARGTIGYIAPEVFSRNYGSVSYKSDVYSFGMLLIEMLGVKINMVDGAEGDSSQAYFPEWIYNRLSQGEELVIEIEREDGAKVAKKLIIVGLWCIQWFPVDRPSMKLVIQMLEGEDIPDMPPNPFGYTKQTITNTTSHESIDQSSGPSVITIIDQSMS